MTALMAYSEYKEIKGELKDIETAFETGQRVAFAYMADCLGASLTYGGLERVIKKIESGRRLKNKMKTKQEENA